MHGNDDRGHVSPAYAGMIPKMEQEDVGRVSEPRIRGDDPSKSGQDVIEVA